MGIDDEAVGDDETLPGGGRQALDGDVPVDRSAEEAETPPSSRDDEADQPAADVPGAPADDSRETADGVGRDAADGPAEPEAGQAGDPLTMSLAADLDQVLSDTPEESADAAAEGAEAAAPASAGTAATEPASEDDRVLAAGSDAADDAPATGAAPVDQADEDPSPAAADDLDPSDPDPSDPDPSDAGPGEDGDPIPASAPHDDPVEASGDGDVAATAPTASGGDNEADDARVEGPGAPDAGSPPPDAGTDAAGAGEPDQPAQDARARGEGVAPAAADPDTEDAEAVAADAGEAAAAVAVAGDATAEHGAAAAAAAAATSVPVVGTPPDGKPPVAPVRPTRRTVHGVVLEDPYAWLRAENWREVMRDPSRLAAPIRAYLQAENDHAASVMAPTEALQETLLAELRGRIKEDDSTVPLPDGEFAYAMRYAAGAEHPRLVRTTRQGHMEKVLLDVEHEAVGHGYFRLGTAEHSPNHRWLAWSSDTTGGEEFAVQIRDTARGHDLADRIERTAGGVAWASDNETLFYVRLDENHRPASVWRHRRGTDASGDVLVYEEPDPGFFVGVDRTLCGRFLAIHCHDHQTSEWRLVPADRPTEAPRLVAERVTAEEYTVAPHGSSLYVLTNADGAEDFKIARAPLAAPERAEWIDVVPHVPGRLIVSMVVFDGHLVRLERENGLPRIVVRRLADGEEHAIAFEEEAYSLGLTEGYEFDTRTLRFTYASMTTPPRVYDYDMDARERVLRKEQEIPSGHDPEAYVTRRVEAPAPDGETVPVSLLHRKDTPLDGTAPCLLYGYGAYGITIPAGFNANALSLVDRGFVFAIAHVRGGKDKGFRWYRLGRREHKTNTFTDFLAAADHLVAEGFTARGRIVAQGGSAGGMLMGVVANTGEDRFAGIVAEVPFVDVLNTMLDPSLPLTPPEWPEWGNPIEDEEAFHRIRSYSPYDNVDARPYPPILALAGVSDPRVTYWEPAKWVARIRALRTNDAPLALKTNMEAGHGGASGRFERLYEVAFSQAFAIMAARGTLGQGA